MSLAYELFSQKGNDAFRTAIESRWYAFMQWSYLSNTHRQRYPDNLMKPSAAASIHFDMAQSLFRLRDVDRDQCSHAVKVVSCATAAQSMSIMASNCLADAKDFSLSPTAAPSGLLVEDGVNPAREREIEALFAIGNGYMGMRASIPEGTRFSHPSTFVAGVFVPDGGMKNPTA